MKDHWYTRFAILWGGTIVLSIIVGSASVVVLLAGCDEAQAKLFLPRSTPVTHGGDHSPPYDAWEPPSLIRPSDSLPDDPIVISALWWLFLGDTGGGG